MGFIYTIPSFLQNKIFSLRLQVYAMPLLRVVILFELDMPSGP